MILKKFEDIVQPIEDIWKNIKYKNIDAKNKYNQILANKKLIHTFDDDVDNLMLHALNYYDNLNCFAVFGKNKNNAYKYYIDNFSDDYSLYGIKHISVNSKIIPKIMYQLLFPRMFIKTKHDLFDILEEQYTSLYNYKEEFIDITILVVCKKDLDKKYPKSDIIDKNFCIYIPNTKESIWHCASVFFCKSTIDFLEKQNFDFFLTKDNEKSKKMFLKYRSWMYNNIDNKNRSQFILYSSVILYLLGHRQMNDLDLYVHYVNEEIVEKLEEFKNNEMYNFIDFKVKNTDNWPLYWNTWLDIWAQKCGAKYFEELLANPKYHFYFLGVKIISLECDVVRRLERNRPRAYADLIALRKRYSYKINIPPIPSKTIKYVSIVDKSEDEINKLIKDAYIDKSTDDIRYISIDKSTNEINILIKDGVILNEKQKELKIECKNDIERFINTIIYALNTRYRMVFTIEEIKRELNMDSKINIKRIENSFLSLLESDTNNNKSVNNSVNKNEVKKIKITIKKVK